MPMALDHINVYLLEDSDGWFLIDTGLNIEMTREIWLKIAQQHFCNLPVKGIICTHFHYDHASLAPWLMEQFDAPLYMTYGEYFTTRALAGSRDAIGSERQKSFYQRHGMSDDLIDKMLTACRRDPFMSHYPPDFNRIREGDTLEIGGRTWHVLIGEGHSPEHACLYCEEDALLIAGDQLLPEISSNVLVSDVEPESEPLSLWLASLEKLMPLKAETLVMPSHGPVFKNLQARVEQLQAHHVNQLDLLRHLATQNIASVNTDFTGYEALRCMFDRPLSPIEQMLAMGETLAHLAWLCRAGELIRKTGEQGVYYYSAPNK